MFASEACKNIQPSLLGIKKIQPPLLSPPQFFLSPLHSVLNGCSLMYANICFTDSTCTSSAQILVNHYIDNILPYKIKNEKKMKGFNFVI